MNQSHIRKVSLGLVFIGMLISIYLTYSHFSEKTSVCDFTSTISCSTVNTSIYSSIFYVPVALVGLIWFILALVMLLRVGKAHMEGAFLLWAIVGVLGIPYLVWAEFVLGVICPFCTVIHVILVLLLVLSVLNYRKSEFALEWVKSVKKVVVYAVIMLVVFALFSAYFKGKEVRLETNDFAQCLTQKGAVMYGSYICSHCINQKNLFGESFSFVQYVECHPNGPNPQTELCELKDIGSTPTWTLEVNGTEVDRRVGFLTFDELKAFSKC